MRPKQRPQAAWPETPRNHTPKLWPVALVYLILLLLEAYVIGWLILTLLWRF